MATIVWQESNPSNTSKLAKAPPFLRGLWTNISSGVGVSLEWPGAAGGSDASHGQLKLGASKAFYAAASLASNPGTGFLMLTSDTSELFAYSSTSTLRVGSGGLMEHETNPAGAVWIEQFGSFSTDVDGSSNSLRGGVITFPIPYDGVPTVLIFSSSTVHAVNAGGATPALFVSQYSGPDGAHTYYWTSLGTVTP